MQNTLDLKVDKTDKKSIKQILIDHMARGYGVCLGSAISISGWHQSAGRRLQELMADYAPMYSYFEAEAARESGSNFRVFFNNDCKNACSIGIRKHLSGNGYQIVSVLGTQEMLGKYTIARSKVYATVKEARANILPCTQR